MNREVEKGRALDEAESQQVIASLIKQRRDSIEQFTQGRTAGSGRRVRPRRSSSLEAYLPPPVDAADLEQRGRRRHRRNGRRVAKGHGPCDESCDEPHRRSNRRRKSRQRSRAQETRRVKRANLFARLSSNDFERHAQASHPSSMRLLSKGRSLFFIAVALDDGSQRCRDADRFACSSRSSPLFDDVAPGPLGGAHRPCDDGQSGARGRPGNRAGGDVRRQRANGRLQRRLPSPESAPRPVCRRCDDRRIRPRPSPAR